jgi:hypothetical protein
MYCPKSRANKIWKLLPESLRPIWDLIKKRRRIPEEFAMSPLISFECLLKIRKYNYKVEYNPKVDKIISERLNEMDREFMKSTIENKGSVLDRISYNYDKINRLVKEKGLDREIDTNAKKPISNAEVKHEINTTKDAFERTKLIKTETKINKNDVAAKSKGSKDKVVKPVTNDSTVSDGKTDNKKCNTMQKQKSNDVDCDGKTVDQVASITERIKNVKNVVVGDKKTYIKQKEIKKSKEEIEKIKAAETEKSDLLRKEQYKLENEIKPIETVMRLRQEKAQKLKDENKEMSTWWFPDQEKMKKNEEEAEKLYALNRKDRDKIFGRQMKIQKLSKEAQESEMKAKNADKKEYKKVTVTKSNINDVLSEQDKIIQELENMERKPKKKVVEVSIKKEMVVKKEFICKYCNGNHHPDVCPKRK